MASCHAQRGVKSKACMNTRSIPTAGRQLEYAGMHGMYTVMLAFIARLASIAFMPAQ